MRTSTDERIKTAHQEICSLKQDVEAAHERVNLAENESRSAAKRVEDLQKFSEDERQVGRYLPST